MTAEPDQNSQAKIACAEFAAGFVRSGMRIGLGTGSTARWLVVAIGRRVRECSLKVTVVATSTRCAQLARQEGLDPVSLQEAGWLDLTIDGADEISPELDVIKGGGGALLQEKIVAESSDRFVVIADETKRSASLGEYPLPVEVTPFGWQSTHSRIGDCLRNAGIETVVGELRSGADGRFITDEGNLILDFNLGPVSDPAGLHADLVKIAGVVETGFFIGHCERAVIGRNDGTILVEGRSRSREGE